MKFLDLIKRRQSDRKYLDKPVEREKLDRCIEAARLAPSASNSQPWKFIIIDDKKLKNEVANATFTKIVKFNSFVPTAPVIIVITIDKPKLMLQMGNILKKTNYGLIDIGIATEHFCLQATEEGLGTCILGWFDEKKIKKILGIPKKNKIGLVISLGYSGHKTIREKKRKSIKEISNYNNYNFN
ncbi:MAG: nitroreductase family protein [Candidatus Marinimicrobia bacterium]|nr:nitroreductase family protein [Candidatus Neomarinimicrobiota bacterium]